MGGWPDTTIGMTTNHQPPTTNHWQPTTNHQQPTTNHKPQQQQEEQHKEQQQPTSNHQPPTANNQQPQQQQQKLPNTQKQQKLQKPQEMQGSQCKKLSGMPTATIARLNAIFWSHHAEPLTRGDRNQRGSTPVHGILSIEDAIRVLEGWKNTRYIVAIHYLKPIQYSR